jgi:glycosyltransferase involved in cell wall biosynthesis
MINVLWLASWYPNRVDKFSGDFIERHAIAVSRYVKLTVLFIVKDESLKGHEVEVDKTEATNLTVYKVYYGNSKLGGPLEKIFSLRKYVQLQKKIYRQIEKETGKPDLVHVQVAMKAGMLARWLKKTSAIPFLVTEHWSGYNPESRPNIYHANWLFKHLNKKILQEADLLLPVSDALGKMINQFVAVPYQPVPNVVNTDLFYYKPLLTPSKKFRFIHPSFMNYPKNPEGILMACKMVKEKEYDFELKVIGNQEDWLTDLARQYDLSDNIIFEPPVQYKEVAHQMQLSSALLLFSRYENLPCVLLEALCCGLPVVSSRVGGIGEVIDDNNGLLVES